MNKIQRSIERILRIIEQQQKACEEIKDEVMKLQALVVETDAKEPPPLREESSLSEQECQDMYTTLCKEYQRGGTVAIEQFVKGLKKRDLVRFCRVNNIPINPKDSKAHIVRELRSYVAQSVAIRADVKPVYGRQKQQTDS